MRKFARLAALALPGLLVLSSCGGSSGDGDSSTGDTTSEAVLDNAADAAGRNLVMPLDNLGSLGVGTGVVSGDTNADVIQLGTESVSFFDYSLGLSSADTVITREDGSDVLIVDPDDDAICIEGLSVLALDASRPELCRQMAESITVRVDPDGSDAGSIHYRFDDAEVLVVSYEPRGGAYEVNLAGVQAVRDKANSLSGESLYETAVMSGVLRMSTTVENDTLGAENIAFMLNVIEPISVQPVEASAGQDRIELGVSTLLSMTTDATSGNVSVGVDIGAADIVLAQQAINGALSDVNIQMGALTGGVSFNANSDAVELRNIGLGDLPLTVRINDAEAMRLNFKNFSATVNPVTNQVVFSDPVSIRWAFDALATSLGSLPFDLLELSMPANTLLNRSDNGVVQVIDGSLQYNVQGSSLPSGDQSISIGSGECVDNDPTDNTGLTLAAVACN